MSAWLLKTEPNEFSFDDLVKNVTEPWNGVANFMALRNMKAADQHLLTRRRPKFLNLPFNTYPLCVNIGTP